MHRPEVMGGVRETEASALLRQFFATLRSPPDGATWSANRGSST